jgi:hypothetical protein
MKDEGKLGRRVSRRRASGGLMDMCVLAMGDSIRFVGEKRSRAGLASHMWAEVEPKFTGRFRLAFNIRVVPCCGRTAKLKLKLSVMTII